MFIYLISASKFSDRFQFSINKSVHQNAKSHTLRRLRDELSSMIWFAPHAPHGSVFVPV